MTNSFFTEDLGCLVELECENVQKRHTVLENVTAYLGVSRYMPECYHILIIYVKYAQSILQSVKTFFRVICDKGECHTIQLQEWQHTASPVYLQAQQHSGFTPITCITSYIRECQHPTECPTVRQRVAPDVRVSHRVTYRCRELVAYLVLRWYPHAFGSDVTAE